MLHSRSMSAQRTAQTPLTAVATLTLTSASVTKAGMERGVVSRTDSAGSMASWTQCSTSATALQVTILPVLQVTILH